MKNETKNNFQKNEVLVFPSEKLHCYDKMPRVDLLMTNLSYEKDKKPRVSNKSTTQLLKKVLVDYISEIAKSRIEHQ